MTLFLGIFCPAFCCGDTLHCRLYFPVGSSTPDLSYRDNGVRLDSLLSGIRSRQAHSVLRRISMRSGSSPEGNSASNRRLSDERLASLRGLIPERLPVPDSVFACTSSGNDWEGLASLVKASDMPYREEALRILRDTPEWVTRNGVVVDSRKRQLMNLRGGRVWHYMAEHFFPELRNCSVIECEFEPVSKGMEGDTVVLPRQAEPRDTVVVRDTIERTVVIRDTVQAAVPVADVPKAFYMGLKTNLLYDALLVPNIGVELYPGKGWTVGGNWMYARWNSNKRHNYWRLYGGELDVRKYFGRRAAENRLQDTIWAFTGSCSRTISRQEEKATWAASRVAPSGKMQLRRGCGVRLLVARGPSPESGFRHRRGLLGRRIPYIRSRWRPVCLERDRAASLVRAHESGGLARVASGTWQL